MIKTTIALITTLFTLSVFLSPATANSKLTEEKIGLHPNIFINQIIRLKENDKDCGENTERCIEQGMEDGA
ncbi:MAG: hypothetical protein ACRBBJ_11185 [Rhodomicrobiaceae bacterium]